MRKVMPVLLGALCLLAGPARADVVEASSTTMLLAGQQTRGGAPGQTPSLATVVPAYEILTLSARDIGNPVADHLEVVLSTWGSYDFSDLRWDNGTGSKLTGDVTTGYVKGELFKRHLVLQVGREYVALGSARMVQIDGGSAVLVLPYGFAVSGYAGSPVSQRFQSRGATVSWNPEGGDLAYGGRVSWTLPISGGPGRGLELGASTAVVKDGKDFAREDVGVDLRLQPVAQVVLTGFGVWSLAEKNRLAEATVLVTWTPQRKLHLTADFQQVAPDLFLPRTSILSVFSDTERTAIGGGVSYDVNRALTLVLDGHVDLQPTSKDLSGTYTGYDLTARAAWHARGSSAGAEVGLLDASENGYFSARLYGRRDFGPAFLAADVLAHFFRESINAEKQAFTGVLTGGYELGGGWAAVLAGRAGVTVFMERQYELLAKLVYNQTYSVREVR
ncbi:MAG TPA: hypothetical protein VLU43_11335 [Anaeromyxobacteraceae bacterium]|nr:hypothetical protein [Anaeromyxobacteraceae bacterium]